MQLALAPHRVDYFTVIVLEYLIFLLSPIGKLIICLFCQASFKYQEYFLRPMMNYVVDRNADVRQVQSTWSYFFYRTDNCTADVFWSFHIQCRAIFIGFALLRSVIGPKNSRLFLNQLDTKLKPIRTWSPAFSRALFSYFSSERSFPFSWLADVISMVLVTRHSIEIVLKRIINTSCVLIL